MGKRYYLIDFENVGIPGIEDAGRLTDNDCVILFSSKNSAKISTAVLASFNRTKLIVKEVPQGSQSVDMHLVTCLGYLIGKNAGSEYTIISKDLDYDSIIRYWNEEYGIKIQRQDSLQSGGKADGRTALNNAIMKELSKAAYGQETIGQAASGVVKLYDDPNRRQKAHGALVQAFGQKTGLDIYNRIKKYL